MYDTTAFKKNLKIEIDGEPFVIVECTHVKPGKGVAFVKTRIKSLITGRVRDENYRSGAKVEKPNLEARDMQYLYKEDPHYIFMDTTTYDQIRLEESNLESALPYLIDNLEVEVLFHNDKAISVELPNFVEIRIAQTDPGFKGNTATGATKPATLETGHVIHVPLYLSADELIKVDTRTGEFSERANK